MIVMSCSNISLSFGTTRILDNISFNLEENDIAGIVGVNGAGKTTLFKILAGMLQPDSGDIFTAKGRKVRLLQQNTGLELDGSLWDAALSPYRHLIELETSMREAEEKIHMERDEEKLTALVREHAALTERYENGGGYQYISRARGVLRGLGFQDDQFDLPVQALSGGQKTRLALAALLLEEPDILLLDEPTNHLDIQALEWLESFLKDYHKCVLLISHDRYFLDAVTNRTLELENCECHVYQGNYTRYLQQKAADRQVQEKHYELQQKEIVRMEAFIEQQHRWNREKNIKAAESRQKAIDRLEPLEKPKNLPQKIRIKLKSGVISGNDVLFVDNLAKEYPGKPLFRDVSFRIHRNERVFILGPNGCGKSTLLKILTSRLAQTDGSIEYGHNVEPGYYDQELQDLDESHNVLEEVWDENQELNHTQVRNALASFLFKGEDVLKPICVLSGGEKCRVGLVKLMLSGSNFLLLDEPTNHLDINSREVLEASLQDFDGTILAVSHDRYFINKLASRILEFDGTGITDIQGDYTHYLEYRERRKANSGEDGESVRVTASKQEHQSSKEARAKLRRLEKQYQESEQQIEAVENRLSGIAIEMEQEENLSDHIKLSALQEEQIKLEEELEALYRLWEASGRELEELQAAQTE